MICRNCGKVLKEYDKFCSNCGTIVEREGTEEFVFTAPERDFEWNVHAFPTGEHHKTKDAVFDWGIDDSEFRRRPRSESDSSFFENKKTEKEPDVEQMKEVIIEPIGSFSAEPKPEAVPESISEQMPEPEPVPVSEPASEPMPESVPEPISEPMPESVPEPMSEQMPDPVSETIPGPATDQTSEMDESFDPADAVSGIGEQPGQMTEPEKKMTRPVIEPLMESPEKPKEKKSFFARFSKDRNATLEQPVITDEQIEQARAESMQKRAMEEAAVSAEIPEDMPEGMPEEIVSPVTEMPGAMSEIPDEPIMPDIPEVPETPAMSEIPDEPIMPDFPEVPEAPLENESFEMPPVQEEPVLQPYHVDFDWKQQPELQKEFASAYNEAYAGNVTENAEDDIFDDVFERELFGGSAVAGISDGGEGLSRYAAGIDRFYTVNKRNEEFQKLLDSEYEKFREGRPLDDSIFSANVQAIKDSTPSDGHGDKVSGIVDMAFINDQVKKASFIDRKTIPYEIVSDDRTEASASDEVRPEPVSTQESSWADAAQTSGEFVMPAAEPEEPTVTTEPAVPAEPEEFAPEPAKEPESDLPMGTEQEPEMQPEEEEKFDQIKEMFGFEGPAGDKQAQDADGGKSAKQAAAQQKAADKGKPGGAGKIVIIILSVILAVLLIALGIKLIAPDSSFAQQMDSIVDSFTQLFTGKQGVAAAVKTMIIGG